MMSLGMALQQTARPNHYFTIDQRSTRTTSFFREMEHFRFLEDVALPRAADRDGPLSIWSAGCSTGEEPYTVAMVVRDALRPELARQTRILATDMSYRLLRFAAAGEYKESALVDVSSWHRRRHFVRARTGVWRVAKTTRRMVRFALLNLMSDWPMRRPFDVILCRNVMGHLDRETQQRLTQRFADMLCPGGHLFVGHSESLSGMEHGLRCVQPAVYVK